MALRCKPALLLGEWWAIHCFRHWLVKKGMLIKWFQIVGIFDHYPHKCGFEIKVEIRLLFGKLFYVSVNRTKTQPKEQIVFFFFLVCLFVFLRNLILRMLSCSQVSQSVFVLLLGQVCNYSVGLCWQHPLMLQVRKCNRSTGQNWTTALILLTWSLGTELSLLHFIYLGYK